MARPAIWLDDKKFLPFSLYALLIAVLGALIVECIKDLGKDAHLLWWTAVLSAVVLSMGLFYNRSLQRWLAEHQRVLSLDLNERVPAKSRGLVLLVSRGVGVSSGKWAIHYHASQLTHLWLVHSSDQESIDGAIALQVEARQHNPNVAVFPRLLNDLSNVEAALDLVRSIHRDARHQGLSPSDIICDFTGMPKAPSAGMVLACIGPEERLQYMRPVKFNPDGSPDPSGESVPVEIQLRYENLESLD
jgi:hypothetical protein